MACSERQGSSHSDHCLGQSLSAVYATQVHAHDPASQRDMRTEHYSIQAAFKRTNDENVEGAVCCWIVHSFYALSFRFEIAPTLHVWRHQIYVEVLRTHNPTGVVFVLVSSIVIHEQDTPAERRRSVRSSCRSLVSDEMFARNSWALVDHQSVNTLVNVTP